MSKISQSQNDDLLSGEAKASNRRAFALITGASMGLGEQFARQLAARGLSLIITARSTQLLQNLAEELRSEFGVEVICITADLSSATAPHSILTEVQRHGIAPQWLINNAGFGDAGAFEALDPARNAAICMVNVTALTHLTSLFLPLLKQHAGEARVINVASVAGLQPIPYFAVYSATKAYVISLSEALHEEFKPLGIRVTCSCPTYTATNFGANNGIQKKSMGWKDDPVKVVSAAIRASDAGHCLVMHKALPQQVAVRLLPRIAIRKAAGAVAKTYR